MHNFAILDFDSSESIFRPTIKQNIKFNDHLIICFYDDIIDYLEKNQKIKRVSNYKTQVGNSNLYNIRFNGKDVSILTSPTGAPMAVGLLEEAIMYGVKYVIAYGMCGVIDDDNSPRVFIPNSAVRDEGTSFHYMKPSSEVEVDKSVSNVLKSVMEYRAIPYETAKTWSTDGVYRAPANIIKKRYLNGCLTIEMECSALVAASKFRNIKFGQILYSYSEEYKLKFNNNEWNEVDKTKMELFYVALESCIML